MVSLLTDTAGVRIHRVAICISTLGRPAWLERLLRALGALQFRTGEPPRIVVVVADNSASGDAQGLVVRLSGEIPWEVRYVHEPRRGISYARNAAVKEALVTAPDAVAFIDDDEVPEPFWLDHLLSAQRSSAAHVVVGPVIPVFDDDAPTWVIRGGFFERPAVPDGARLKTAPTNNTLVVRQVFEAVGWFEPGFGLGDDNHFFMRSHLAGAVIVRANAALVKESVPSSRATARWLVWRACREYNAYVLAEKHLLSAVTWVPRRAFVLGGVFLTGIFNLLVSPVRGRSALVAGLRAWAGVFGGFAGMFGLVCDERRIHGR